MRTAARETAFQMALRNCSKEVGGKVSIYVILVKGEYMQSSTYFLQKVSASHEEQSSPWSILVLFQIWGDTRIGLIKSAPENSSLSEDLFCQFFPEHRVPHFSSPPWTPLRGCWKSAAEAAHDLLLVEVDGKCQWWVPIVDDNDL